MAEASRAIHSGEMGLRAMRVPVGPMTMPHVHDQIEILVMERGWILHEQGGERIRLPQGGLLSLWAAFPHRTLRASAGASLLAIYLPLSWFIGNPAWSRVLTRWMGRQSLMAAPDGGHTAWALRLLELVRDETPVTQHRLRLEAELHLLRHLPAGTAPEAGCLAVARSHHVERMISHILRYYDTPMTVASIAGTVGLHPTYAQDLFRRATGLPLWEFVLQVRTAQAQRLLADPDRSVLAAGLEAGFGSASRFHATFKRVAGQTPASYRRQVLAG